MSYEATRNRLQGYFDGSAMEKWAQLTSDAPVSRIRQTVREGRDEMRAAILGALPHDLSGKRILDAGCGTGQMAIELAERGAEVVAIDISPALIDLAQDRTPGALFSKIVYMPGDMLKDYGTVDFTIAMDSLIHYDAADIYAALETLLSRTREKLIFTVAPKTALLTAMWWAGQLFPGHHRSPAIQPITAKRINRSLGENVDTIRRVNRGFYISEALEIAK
ncbi:MAG: magnesium protoporphyrin IX methyltransferase [Pseudomonadota bacterium]